ncbi:unnamed protein product [Symbiodinium sp. KB8]|nr:unnamed protein product [Symbiodinium sp. KB8]
MHFWCDVHRLSTCKTWQLAIVDSHVSAMISLSLLMRECGALEQIHDCMKRVVENRLTVEYDTPPAGQVKEHREAVLNLLLGSNLTKKLGQCQCQSIAGMEERSPPSAGLQAEAGPSDDNGGGVGDIPLDSEPSTTEDKTQAAAASGDAMPNWKDLKLSMKRLVLAWIKTQPGAVLMLTRATMQAGVQLMRPRSYRVLEAWQNDDVRSAFTALRDCFHSPLPALPLTARTNSMKVLGFRLLARVAGALHLLLRVTRAGFPHRLFSLLQPATSQERLDLAEKLLSSPACLWDHATKHILEKFPTPQKLTSTVATATLQALALMAENDVVSIETRHAAARRLLMARQQTWSTAFPDLAAEHLCRQARAEMHDVFGNVSVNSKQSTSRKKRQLPKKRRHARTNKRGRKHDRVEKRGGGAQRAFFHERLQLATKDDWKSRGRLFSRLHAEFKNLTAAQLQHYKDLGEMGKLAARHGGRPFVPPARESRAASERRMVPASEFEQLALTTVQAAENKAVAQQRLHLSKARADAVELQQYQCEHAFQSHGLVDTLPSSCRPVQTEPGSLPAGYFLPDAVGLSEALCDFMCGL